MSRISSPVFVGRAAELAELLDAWSEVATGGERLCLVYGEAGIGKSRLIAELLKAVGDDAVLRGRCLDVGEGMLPFGPLAEILRGLAPELVSEGLDRRNGRGHDAIAHLVPELPISSAGAGGADPAFGQTRLFTAVAAVLTAAARRRPRCLVIEDAHWLDAASRDLLRFLIDALRDEPVLVLISVRDDGQTRADGTASMLAELDREPHAARLDLARFTREEVSAQLAGILGKPPEAGLAAAVHVRSDGNPFFTEEVVALDIAEGSAVPPSLRDLLLSRISSLDEPGRRLLDVAAVGGRWVADESLRRVAEIAHGRFSAALRAAVREHLVEASPRRDAAGYAFRHALVRDAVYQDLLPTERRLLHAAWAAELETIAPNSAAVAEHWALAGRPDRAGPAAVRAAEWATAAFAHADAARLYGDAIVALDATAAPTIAELDRVDLLERAAQEHELASERDESIERLTQAAADLALLERPDRRIRLLRQLAEVAINRARFPLARWAIDEAMKLVSDEPGVEGASALAAWAMQLSLSGELEASRETAARALTLARRIGARGAEARALRALADLLAMVDVDAGVAELREAAAVAEAAGDIGYAFETLSDIPWALANAGRYVEALAATDATQARATAAGVGGKLLRTHLARRIEYLTALGRFVEAEPDIQAAVAARSWMARLRAAILRARQGRAEDAGRLLRETFELVQPVSPTVPDRGAIALARVNVAIASGDLVGAVGLVEDAGALPGEPDTEAELRLLAVRACSGLVDGAHRRGDRRAWTERARGHLARLAELDAPAGGTATGAIRARTLDAAAELGRIENRDGPEAWVGVAVAWVALSVPERVAYARYREAEARLVRGDGRQSASAALHEAFRTSTRIGAAPLAAEIEALARRARVRLQPESGTSADAAASIGVAPDTSPSPGSTPTPADPHGLTEREREVLALLVAGRTNREIGEALFISPKTAGVHVSNILGKLGATNRVEAASIAHRLHAGDQGPA